MEPLAKTGVEDEPCGEFKVLSDEVRTSPTLEELVLSAVLLFTRSTASVEE